VRILVDEDLASRELIDRLKTQLADHDVLEPERGQPDDAVWDRAQQSRALLLTMNAKEFVPKATHGPTHSGLLLVTRHNDRTRDLRGVQVADLVVRIVRDHPEGLAGQFVWVLTYAGAARGLYGDTTQYLEAERNEWE
jgi:hypothetical protein